MVTRCIAIRVDVVPIWLHSLLSSMTQVCHPEQKQEATAEETAAFEAIISVRSPVDSGQPGCAPAPHLPAAGRQLQDQPRAQVLRLGAIHHWGFSNNDGGSGRHDGRGHGGAPDCPADRTGQKSPTRKAPVTSRQSADYYFPRLVFKCSIKLKTHT